MMQLLLHPEYFHETLFISLFGNLDTTRNKNIAHVSAREIFDMETKEQKN